MHTQSSAASARAHNEPQAAVITRPLAPLTLPGSLSSLDSCAGGKALCNAVGANSALTYLNLKENAVPGFIHKVLQDKWHASRPESGGVGLHF